MDFHVGIRGDGFAMLCCDTRAVQQIITIKNDEEKLIPIDSHKLFAISGSTTGALGAFWPSAIAAHGTYGRLECQLRLRAWQVTYATASPILQAPYNTNLLLAGFDEGKGASLYWLDYLATMHKMNICGTGYGSYFALSLFDKLWTPDVTQEQALEMMKAGVAEVRKRLVVAPERFHVKVVDSGGIRDLGFI